MNFEQLEAECRDVKDTFLDTVYDHGYYPEFLREMQMIDYHSVQQWMKEYIAEKCVKPTKSIEAHYMIDPNITPPKT